MELEIDEQSDDEDTRQAHALLRASLDQAVDIVVSQPPVLTTQGAIATTASHTGHQGHLGFAVSIFSLYIKFVKLSTT